MRRVECGGWNVECGGWNAECGGWNAECVMADRSIPDVLNLSISPETHGKTMN